MGLEENLVRIVVDSMARTPIDADIFKKGEGKRIIAVCENAPEENIQELSKIAEIICIGQKRVDLNKLLIELKNRGIKTLMVEGGATLNWGLICEGLVDEIYTFIGNMIIAGKSAPTLVDGEGSLSDFCKLGLISCERLDEGVLLKWKVQQ
jgi:2,5-diamino-6-(ribosylamino)-4(3H)-pyrimidinone 5'-phosphate reductase